MKRVLMLTISFLVLASVAEAQAFSSGSTGADGPLDLTSGDKKVQLPESGVLNYTTVNIPLGRTLTFKRNSRNTPVIMLAQGAVTITGTISVDAGSDPDTPFSPTTPGPGGFYGALSGPGFGPGGGTPTDSGKHGRWVGPLSLVPIIGGSGAAGFGCSGYGGGGAIVVASSTTIIVNGQVMARSFYGCTQGPGGSGGAVRLIANSINVSGNLWAYNASSGLSVSLGVIRIETPPGALTFTGSAIPAAVLSSINPTIVSNTPAALTIVSIGGFAVPSNAGQRFNTADLLLPNQIAEPITVVVTGNNIPVGTQVTIGQITFNGTVTSTPAPLQGTFASSTASPSVSGLNRTGGVITYLLASATFDPPPPSAPFNQKGANYVEKIRVESLIGEKPKFIFLRKDGTEIKPEMLAREFLQQFGQ